MAKLVFESPQLHFLATGHHETRSLIPGSQKPAVCISLAEKGSLASAYESGLAYLLKYKIELVHISRTPLPAVFSLGACDV